MDLNRANIIPLRKNGEMDFIARLLATMAGLWVTTRVVSSISIESSSPSQTVIVLVFTAVNSIIKPIVTTLAFPLYLLTFGLFALVTNSLLFALTGWLSTSLGFPMTTGGFWSCLFGAVITSVVSSIVSGILRDKKDKRD